MTTHSCPCPTLHCRPGAPAPAARQTCRTQAPWPFWYAAAMVLVACLASLLAVSPALAQVRTFPANSQQVFIEATSPGLVVLNSATVRLASGVLIFNENNRTVVRSRLPTGVVARVVLNPRNEVQRIWILTQDEIEATPQGQPGSRGRLVPNQRLPEDAPLPAELLPGD